MRLRLLLVALVVFAGSASARAANQPNALFDRVATAAAGKPTAVHCENSWDVWVANGLGDVNGVVFHGYDVAFISPRQCETLWALAWGENVGSYYAASALLTLLHEAMHIRGVVDEGEADCLALPLVGPTAVAFGVPETVTVEQQQRGTRTVTRRVGKRILRFTVPTVTLVQVSVPNPYLARIVSDAMRWHRSKPPEYQGGC